MIFNGVGFVLILVAAVLFQVLFLEEDDPLKIQLDWTES